MEMEYTEMEDGEGGGVGVVSVCWDDWDREQSTQHNQGWARPYTHLPTTMNLPNLWWRPTTSRTADFGGFKSG